MTTHGGQRLDASCAPGQMIFPPLSTSNLFLGAFLRPMHHFHDRGKQNFRYLFLFKNHFIPGQVAGKGKP